MLFDDVNGFKWKPHYIQVVRRYWLGETKASIATEIGVSASTIDKILNHDKAIQVIAHLEANTLDTMLEVQTAAQAVALEAIDVKIQGLRSGNEALRQKCATELLGLAGHTPTRKIEIKSGDAVVDKYKDKSELDLRRELLKMLNTGEQNTTEDKGPDGNLIN